MDGPLAMGYARTRYADSDVGRMGRQRELFAAITEQVSAYEGLVTMPEILESLSGSLSNTSGLVVTSKISLIICRRGLMSTASVSGLPLVVESVSELDHTPSNS